MLLAACASAPPLERPHDPRAAGGLPAYHPFSLRGMAYGRSEGGATAKSPPVGRSAPELEGFLLPQSKTRPVPVQVTSQGPARRTRATQPAPATAALEVGAVPAVSTLATATHDPVDAQAARRYAQREAQSRDQQRYRGGDVVVITASTLVIVLLVVLLVVLLIR